jgi:hypothetical protein
MHFTVIMCGNMYPSTYYEDSMLLLKSSVTYVFSIVAKSSQWTLFLKGLADVFNSLCSMCVILNLKIHFRDLY